MQIFVKSMSPVALKASHIKPNDHIVGIDGQLFDRPIAGAVIGKLCSERTEQKVVSRLST